VLVRLLELESPDLGDLPIEPDDTDTYALFPEARRRRRRRLLRLGLVASVLLALTVFAIEGSGRTSGPPPTSSRGRPSQVPPTHQSSRTGHASSPTGPAVCRKSIVPLAPRSTRASASLLPCYEAPSLSGIATQPLTP
jgi:hypothetical protein